MARSTRNAQSGCISPLLVLATGLAGLFVLLLTASPAHRNAEAATAARPPAEPEEAIASQPGDAPTSGSAAGCPGIDPQLLSGMIAIAGDSVPQNCAPAEGGTAGIAGDDPIVLNPDTTVHRMGDANCDREVSAVDVLSLLEVRAGLAGQDGCATAGDVNCDGEIDGKDAVLLLGDLAGKQTEVEECPPIGAGDLVSLTIDKFGQGEIGGALECGLDCYKTHALYPAGTELSLYAIPDNGWQLHPWDGCTSTSEDNTYCNVTLTADVTVWATFGSTEPVQFTDETVVLDAATMALFLRQEGDPQDTLTLFFASQATAVAALQAGNVVVSSDSAHPLMREVISVTTGTEEIAVATAPAGLADAFATGTVVVQADLEPEVGEGAEGFSAQGEECNFPSISAELKLEGVIPISGSLCAKPDFVLVMNFNPFEMRARAGFDLNVTIAATAAQDFAFELPICPPACVQPITFTIGYIPVVLQPEIGVDVGLEWDSGNVSASLTVGYGAWIELKHTPGEGWKTSAGHNPTFDPDFTYEKSMSAKLYIRPEAAIKLYEVIGPVFEVEGFVRVKWQNFQGQDFWEISAGLGIGAGIELGIGVFSINISFPIYEKEWPLFTHPPNLARNLTVERNAGGRIGQPKSTFALGFLDNCDAFTPCTGSANFPYATNVLLRAFPEQGFGLLSWTGCDEVIETDCWVKIDDAKTVKAEFTAGMLFLYSDYEQGQGSVATVSPYEPLWPCGAGPCVAGFKHAAVPTKTYTLKATPKEGYRFGSWQECDQPNGDRCTVSLSNASRTVKANFVKSNLLMASAFWYPHLDNGETEMMLSVSPGGATESCTSGSFEYYFGCRVFSFFDEGTVVRITPTAPQGHVLKTWVGCDSLEGVQGEVCVVTMNTLNTGSARYPKAYFGQGNTLTVEAVGLGGADGYVTSEPARIFCGVLTQSVGCTSAFSHLQAPVLTAHTSSANVVIWEGCTVDPNDPNVCQLNTDEDRTVKITFQPIAASLSVFLFNGGAGGRIVSSPPGINCGKGSTDCGANFPFNTEVTLTAIPDQGYGVEWLDHFSDACGGTVGNTCKLTMSKNLGTRASFDPLPNKLTVVVQPSSAGNIKSNPVGIDCGNGGLDCNENFANNTSVFLTATAAPGWKLTHWTSTAPTQGCHNAFGLSCLIVPAGNQTVTATFVPTIGPVLTVNVLGGPGTNFSIVRSVDDFGAPDDNIDCPLINCSKDYPAGTLVTLKAFAPSGWKVDWVNSTCSGDYAEYDDFANECYVLMDEDITITFVLIPT